MWPFAPKPAPPPAPTPPPPRPDIRLARAELDHLKGVIQRCPPTETAESIKAGICCYIDQRLHDLSTEVCK